MERTLDRDHVERIRAGVVKECVLYRIDTVDEAKWKITTGRANSTGLQCYTFALMKHYSATRFIASDGRKYGCKARSMQAEW